MLTLPIKKKWFDMILSGEKKEEYRDLSDYYWVRFMNIWAYPAYWGEPHQITFRNGYRKDSPSFVATCTLAMGFGKEEWGAEREKRYYILKICDIEPQVERENKK